MPWVMPGAPARSGIAWYGASQAEERGRFGPDTLAHGVWNVYYAQSSRASGPTAPAFTVVPVTDHPAKFGNISTQGLGGSPDRSLGDFMQVQTGLDGEAVISYVDDTSADRNPDYCQGCGPQTPPEAAGPIMIARQDVGPSLLAGHADLAGGPLPYASISDPVGRGYPDAYFGANGTDTNATPNLDVKGVKITQPDRGAPRRSRCRPRTPSSRLTTWRSTARSSQGGPSGQWIVRWAAPLSTASPATATSSSSGCRRDRTARRSSTPGRPARSGRRTFEVLHLSDDDHDPGGDLRRHDQLDRAAGEHRQPRDAGADGLFSITGFTASQLGPVELRGLGRLQRPRQRIGGIRTSRR